MDRESWKSIFKIRHIPALPSSQIVITHPIPAGNIQIQPWPHFSFRLMNHTPIKQATFAMPKVPDPSTSRAFRMTYRQNKPYPNLHLRGSSFETVYSRNLHIKQYQADSFHPHLFKQIYCSLQANGLTER